MYGTVGHLLVKDGCLGALKGVIQKLEAVPGVLAMSLVGKDDNPSDYFWTIVWQDKAAHDTNAERPEFPAEYQALLDTLAAEPEWHSGEIVYRSKVQP